MVVVVTGVSGAGKTTVGEFLAGELGWRFYDADDFHSEENLDKLKRGVPLTDEDREPWLFRLRGVIASCLADNTNAVLACSALKKKYRDILRPSAEVRFIYLRGDYATIAAQLQNRQGHFMDPGLLESQFADVEEPQPDEHAIIVQAGRPLPEMLGEIRTQLHLS